MKRLVFDIDDTISKTKNRNYETASVISSMRKKIIYYHNLGFEIVIYTSRNMNTYSNNIGKINANTLPIIYTWLLENEIPFDEIHVGKPWCGTEGFYIDDRAIRPNEFIEKSYEEILDIIEESKNSINVLIERTKS